MSYHFSLFLYFISLYIFLIYGVFFNKALHDFDNKRKLTPKFSKKQKTTQHWYIPTSLASKGEKHQFLE